MSSKHIILLKENPGDPAAVRISYMDSATGKLVRQEDKDGLIVGESYPSARRKTQSAM